MSALVQQKTAQKPPKRVFFAATLVIFFCLLSTADSVGFVPDYVDGTAPAQLPLSDLPQLGEETEGPGILPVRIEISAIDLDLAVQNPSTRDVEALDALLTSGPARYVDSAKLAEKGNVIIFAHSSHLPIVHNKMYQAFNNVPDLQAGDSITLVGEDGKRYLYSVTSVAKADVNDGAYIDLSPSLGKKLTLVTCDTLTSKSARYILEADFVGTI